jgi:hypothetical protein
MRTGDGCRAALVEILWQRIVPRSRSDRPDIELPVAGLELTVPCRHGIMACQTRRRGVQRT